MYLQTVGGGCCYAGIRPNIPEIAPLRRLMAHMSRTRKWPQSPNSPPVPTGSRSDERAVTRARRPEAETTPHAQARQAETRVDQGLVPTSTSVSSLQTFGDLIDLHITDMCEVGKPPRREPRPRHSRRSSAIWARRRSGTSIGPSLIDYGKKRAEQGEARLANRSSGPI